MGGNWPAKGISNLFGLGRKIIPPDLGRIIGVNPPTLGNGFGGLLGVNQQILNQEPPGLTQPIFPQPQQMELLQQLLGQNLGGVTFGELAGSAVEELEARRGRRGRGTIISEPVKAEPEKKPQPPVETDVGAVAAKRRIAK